MEIKIDIYLVILVIILLFFIIKLTSNEGFENEKNFFINLNNSDTKFIINLDKRTDRWNITSKRLGNLGFSNLERYKAIEGNRINKDELSRIVTIDAMGPIKKGFRTQHHHLSIGAVGCYLSHINVWELGHSTNKEPYVIIFEDDTHPTMTSDTLQDKLLQLPQDWDICLFGGIYYTDKRINDTFCKLDRFYCLHAYAINKKCIKYLLDNAFPIKQQIDSWLSDLSIERKINVYGLIRNDWMQNEDINNTDIQTPMIEEPL